MTSGKAKGLVVDQAPLVDLTRHLSNSRFQRVLAELWRDQQQAGIVGQD